MLCGILGADIESIGMEFRQAITHPRARVAPSGRWACRLWRSLLFVAPTVCIVQYATGQRGETDLDWGVVVEERENVRTGRDQILETDAEVEVEWREGGAMTTEPVLG